MIAHIVAYRMLHISDSRSYNIVYTCRLQLSCSEISKSSYSVHTEISVIFHKKKELFLRLIELKVKFWLYPLVRRDAAWECAPFTGSPTPHSRYVVGAKCALAVSTMARMRSLDPIASRAAHSLASRRIGLVLLAAICKATIGHRYRYPTVANFVVVR